MEKIKFSPFIMGTMRLGSWGKQFSTAEWQQFINQCLELGIKDFDHADIYGDYTTEADFGNVLKNVPSLRQSIQITTKCGIKIPTENRPKNLIKSYDSSPQYITNSVERSLKNLGTDYIDLLLLHRPDFLMHPEEIARCFDELRSSGKVLHFGVSNFSVSQFTLLNNSYPLENNQIEASLFHLNPFENGQIDQMMTNNIALSAWSPLGGGIEAIENANGGFTTVLKALAKKYQINTGQLLLSWLLRHPANITPILGTTKIERVKEALAIKELTITNDDWYALYSSSKGEKLP